MNLMTNPSHPGEVLNELYLLPLNMSAIDLAAKLNAPRARIESLVEGRTDITIDIAEPLARYFSTTPEYWMNLQGAWDLANPRETIVNGNRKLTRAAS